MAQQIKVFYEFGPFRIDVENNLLLRGAEVVPLPPKAFDLLLTLVQESGRVLLKTELMSRLWPDSFVEEANLSHNVFTLRKALGEVGNEGGYIETIPRRGYRFSAEVTEVRDEGADIFMAERTRSRVVIEKEIETTGSYDQDLIEHARAANATVAMQADRSKLLRSRRLIFLSAPIILGIVCAGLYVQSRANRKAILPPMTTIPLTTFPDLESNPTPSPDGKFVAFNWSRGTDSNIYVKQIDAGTPLRLTSKRGVAGRPRWSPDGRYIAYLHVDDAEIRESSIFIVPAFGGPERKLFSTKEVLGGLDWSPDGTTIAITLRDSVDQPRSIYLLMTDSLEMHRLTSPADGSAGDYYPVFSPDGKMVAFMRAIDYTETTDLHFVSIDGGEPRRLTFDKAKIEGLAWTPDGDTLIFSSKRSGLHRLWRIPVSGGEPEPLTVGTENAYDPSISRAGNRLTYTQKFFDTNIWMVKKTTASEQPVDRVKLISSTLRDENPCLSADGKKIVFESRRSGSHELWVADSDGANPNQLTSFGRGETCNARWSPDGRQIAFESHSEAYPNIYVINADGGRPRKVTNGPLNNCIPSWSKDGRWIYFASNRSDGWQVWKTQPENGEPVQVTTNGGYEAIESNDGQFLYYNKFGYGAVGIFRKPVLGGDETFVFDFLQLESTGDWSLTNDGIYFIHRYDERRKLSAQQDIRFFDFTTHQITTVASLERDPGSNPGLNVSADGQSFVLSKIDTLNWDTMLVENFY